MLAPAQIASAIGPAAWTLMEDFTCQRLLAGSASDCDLFILFCGIFDRMCGAKENILSRMFGQDRQASSKLRWRHAVIHQESATEVL